jgi:cytochrome c peroxidase
MKLLAPNASRKVSLQAFAVLSICIAASAAQAQSNLGLPLTNEYPSQPDKETIALGNDLFVDMRLSASGSMSCASCHNPAHLFTDGLATAKGRNAQKLTRHTPSLLNVRFQRNLFWDGRASDLIAQARLPLLAPLEHGLADENAVAAVVRADPVYAQRFTRAFQMSVDKIEIEQIALALAAYERSLVAGDSRFDRYLYANEAHAMSAAAIRGLALFRGRAQCASCHSIGERSALLCDDAFHASPIPLPTSALERLPDLVKTIRELKARAAEVELNTLISTQSDVASLGRFLATADPKDIGLFKTPSLRNVALSGPYMHDGSVASLQEALQLELYSRGALGPQPLVLTESEQSDVVEFLKSLTSVQFESSRSF